MFASEGEPLVTRWRAFAFCGSYFWSSRADEIWTSSTPPYSAGQSVSDYHMFGPLTETSPLPKICQWCWN